MAAATVVPSGAAARLHHAADDPLGQADGPRLARHRGDLQRVGAGGVGDPRHLPGLTQHPGQPGPGPRIDVQRPGRAVLMRQPVHRPPHLHHTGLPGPVTIQATQMISSRDQPRRTSRGRGTERDLEPTRPGRAGAIQHPDVPRHVIHDPVPIGRRVPGVHPVMIGMPPQAGAVQRTRVDVARALMIGQEKQPPADQHRAGQLTTDPGQDPGEQGIPGGSHPQLAGPAAPVPLPVRGFGGHAPGQQGGGHGFQGQVVDRPVREQPRRGVPGTGDREGPAVLHGLLAGRADDEHLAVGRPPGDPGLRVTPEREPGRVAARGIRGVDLGVAVPPAGPRYLSPVAGEARVADLGAVGGQPPRAAPVSRGEPERRRRPRR